MSRSLLAALVLILVAAPAAAADGIDLVTPTEGATVSSEAPLELGWMNPHYHVMGEVQVVTIATDPQLTNVVRQHGDHCAPYELCPQGATLEALPPGTYYWKVYLYAWDWDFWSPVGSFVSAAPPPPPPPAPPPPPPPAKRYCRVPTLRGRLLGDARRLIIKSLCRVGKVSYTRSPTVPRGRVVRQSPVAGKVLQAGALVQLVVSRGRR